MEENADEEKKKHEMKTNTRKWKNIKKKYTGGNKSTSRQRRHKEEHKKLK